MYSSGCTSVGVNNTSPSWTLDRNGDGGVKGSPAIIRPSSSSDSDGLRYLGTQLVIGGLNQLAYNYSGSALAYIGSLLDGTKLMGFPKHKRKGEGGFWQTH